jgi:predicted phage terminase large subunit-like protein
VTGAIILIMQRLHEDDLVGHVLQQERWEVSFPAIAEQDEEYLIDTPYGPARFGRKAGEALHPEHEPLETLAHTRATVGEYNFAAQFQQAPTPPAGVLIKLEWFRRYDTKDLPSRFDLVLQSWDTANKATELSDYSVCTTWGVANKHYYLLDVVRRRMDYPELKRTVKDLARLHAATVVLIEDKVSGTQIIQELVTEGMRGVTRYQPCVDKFMRLCPQTGCIANGVVRVPTEAPWLAVYLHELTTFPNSKHDDEVDSTAQALEWLNMRPPPSPALYAIPIIVSQPRELPFTCWDPFP